MRKFGLSAIIFFVSISSLLAQIDANKKVTVLSWKKGVEKVTPQVSRIHLTQKQPSFEKEIVSISGKQYFLQIIHNPIGELHGEHWKVALREILTIEDKRVLGDDMIYVDRPGDIGGDSISRKEYVGLFYPYEKNKVILNGKSTLIEWKELYPVKTLREITVDGFCLTLKAGDIEFDEKDTTKIKKFEIVIELRNICSQ